VLYLLDESGAAVSREAIFKATFYFILLEFVPFRWNWSKSDMTSDKAKGYRGVPLGAI
jgi:hypothetical protein